MKYNQDFFRDYLTHAPISLALERSLECEIYTKQKFTRPILDIGCGEGLFARMFFLEKVDTGIDPNQRELDRAEQLGMYDELILCTGANIPKADESYSTIFSNSVLEHIPDVEPVIREAYRLLKPEGKMYVTVPSDLFDHYSVIYQILEKIGLTNLAERYRAFFNSFWNHYHYYSVENWGKLFTRAGFKIIDGFTYDSKQVCLINDALIPFAAVGKIIKRCTNRWILFPAVRRLVILPWFYLLRGLISKNGRVENGGLVFLCLTKGEAK